MRHAPTVAALVAEQNEEGAMFRNGMVQFSSRTLADCED